MTLNNKNSMKNITNGDSGSILSSLFRNILNDLGVTITSYEIMLDKYIERNGMTKITREKSSVRGNLMKEFRKNTMSWNKFINGLMFLNVKKFTLRVEIHHSNNKVTTHYKHVLLDEGWEK